MPGMLLQFWFLQLVLIIAPSQLNCHVSFNMTIQQASCFRSLSCQPLHFMCQKINYYLSVIPGSTENKASPRESHLPRKL